MTRRIGTAARENTNSSTRKASLLVAGCLVQPTAGISTLGRRRWRGGGALGTAAAASGERPAPGLDGVGLAGLFSAEPEVRWPSSDLTDTEGFCPPLARACRRGSSFLSFASSRSLGSRDFLVSDGVPGAGASSVPSEIS
ncbi:MAG: hypothetical protein VX690_02015 [Pseudomonadota bacterium]|nr:hypothetical protein [Pseudomonadota bacterium]